MFIIVFIHFNLASVRNTYWELIFGTEIEFVTTGLQDVIKRGINLFMSENMLRRIINEMN